jgi:hypothetical protein
VSAGTCLHILIVLSSDEEARKLPQGLNEIAQTVDVWPFKVAKGYQSSEGSSTYNLIVSSYEADARMSSRGWNATAFTS